MAPWPQAEKALKDAGIPVETESRPGLVHSIDQVGAQKGALFLRRCFGSRRRRHNDKQMKSTGWRISTSCGFRPAPLLLWCVDIECDGVVTRHRLVTEHMRAGIA